MSGILRKYLAALAEAARWKVAAALSLMVVFSLTEGIGIALLLPTLQAAGFNLASQGEAGRYAKMMAGAIAACGLPPTLPVLLTIFIVLISARSILGTVQTVAGSSANMALTLELRRRLYKAIVDADWLFVVRSRASDFVHALTSEIDRVTVATNRLMSVAADLALVLVLVIVALGLSPLMTALVLGFAAIVALALRHRTRAIQQSGTTFSEANNRLYAAATEHFQSLKTVKTYSAQARSLSIFSDLNDAIGNAMLATVRQHAVTGSWFEVGSIAALGAAIYIAIAVIAVPPAEILILLLLFSRVMPKLMSVHNGWQSVASLLPAFANVIALEERCIAAAEPRDAGGAPFRLTRAVRFERVSFGYGNGARPILREIDLILPAGKITAVVGPSGAGKSTIADLAMGLIAPISGRIMIDAEELSPERARAWRSQLGYVGQDTFLFHDTVSANLSWASPGAGEDEMREALRLAAANGFVDALAGGLGAIVGDRGMQLSHGERQRLALARALLRRPAMLVLDEATNSLDSGNEAHVLGAIEHLRGSVTTLLIAHRLSTLRCADLIYVIEEGRVIESGDWGTLSAQSGSRFRALCEEQDLTA